METCGKAKNPLVTLFLEELVFTAALWLRPPENTDKGRVPILGISGLGWWTENGPKRGFMGGLVPDIPKIWRSKGG
jgi:hypothetical protein